jgi:hypothetical protein
VVGFEGRITTYTDWRDTIGPGFDQVLQQSGATTTPGTACQTDTGVRGLEIYFCKVVL